MLSMPHPAAPLVHAQGPALIHVRPQLSWALVKQLGPLATVNVLNVVCGLIGAQQSPGVA